MMPKRGSVEEAIVGSSILIGGAIFLAGFGLGLLIAWILG